MNGDGGHCCPECGQYWGVAACLHSLQNCAGNALPCPQCSPKTNRHVIGRQEWGYVDEDDFTKYVRHTREVELSK